MQRSIMQTIRKTTLAMVASIFALALGASASFAASNFEGVWKVNDTAGKPFEITLSSGGAAKATRVEGMTGMWKEEAGSAVITWNTGWTTKIINENDHYTKVAYRKGQSLDSTPVNKSEAEKVK